MGLSGHVKIPNGVTYALTGHGLESGLSNQILQQRDKIGVVTRGEIRVRARAKPPFRQALFGAVAGGQGLLATSAAEQFEKMVSGTAAYDSCILRRIGFDRWVGKLGVAVG
jgi:hypothetical protein